jgi:hypothetical protein
MKLAVEQRIGDNFSRRWEEQDQPIMPPVSAVVEVFVQVWGYYKQGPRGKHLNLGSLCWTIQLPLVKSSVERFIKLRREKWS